MNAMIPSFEFQDQNGNPVPSTADPAWKYTVINRSLRTVKNAPPQQLLNGVWVEIPRGSP